MMFFFCFVQLFIMNSLFIMKHGFEVNIYDVFFCFVQLFIMNSLFFPF